MPVETLIGDPADISCERKIQAAGEAGLLAPEKADLLQRVRAAREPGRTHAHRVCG